MSLLYPRYCHFLFDRLLFIHTLIILFLRLELKCKAFNLFLIHFLKMSLRENGFWGFGVGCIMGHNVYTEEFDDGEHSCLELFVWFVGEDRPHMVSLSYFWLVHLKCVADYIEAHDLWDVDEARDWGICHNWEFL